MPRKKKEVPVKKKKEEPKVLAIGDEFPLPEELKEGLKMIRDNITANRTAMDHHANMLRMETESFWKTITEEVPVVKQNIQRYKFIYDHDKHVVRLVSRFQLDPLSGFGV